MRKRRNDSPDLLDQIDEERRVRLRALGWSDTLTPRGRYWCPPMTRGGHGIGVTEAEAFERLDREEGKQ